MPQAAAPKTGAPAPEFSVDPESETLLSRLSNDEQVRGHRVAGVRLVLVVLSSAGMVFDSESLRQKVLQTYPDAVVFFQTTGGKPLGVACPHSVDLVIDLTGPGQRGGWFRARSLRKMGRVVVGRNAGFFRKNLYDRVFDEVQERSRLPKDLLTRERFVQTQVLGFAGIALAQQEASPDRGKTIALELPPMQRL